VVCLEGMAAGKPVVASRVGGLPEVVKDDHNGLLFEPGDGGMLARQLAKLAGDVELRSRLGAQARRDAAEFDWNLIGLRFREIIRRAASDHANRRTAGRDA
jgi:glycosyltransferase involved in cell wall biosynthesis